MAVNFHDAFFHDTLILKKSQNYKSVAKISKNEKQTPNLGMKFRTH